MINLLIRTDDNFEFQARFLVIIIGQVNSRRGKYEKPCCGHMLLGNFKFRGANRRRSDYAVGQSLNKVCDDQVACKPASMDPPQFR